MECEISQPRPAQGATETAGAELRVPLPEREPLPHRRPRRRLACSPGPRRLASGRSPSWPSSSAPAPGGGLSGPARLCPSVRTAGWAVSGVAYGAPAAGTPRSIQSATSSVLETPAAHAPEHGPPPASLCGRPDPEQLPWGPWDSDPCSPPPQSHLLRDPGRLREGPTGTCRASSASCCCVHAQRPTPRPGSPRLLQGSRCLPPAGTARRQCWAGPGPGRGGREGRGGTGAGRHCSEHRACSRHSRGPPVHPAGCHRSPSRGALCPRRTRLP